LVNCFMLAKCFLVGNVQLYRVIYYCHDYEFLCHDCEIAPQLKQDDKNTVIKSERIIVISFMFFVC